MPKFPFAMRAGAAGLLALAALLAGCGSLAGSEMSRRTDAEIEMARQRQTDEKTELTSPGTYLSLIRRMQEQGMYYASLAHIDAYVQRFGRAPEVVLLRADALRETDQLAAAEADYRAVVDATSALGAGTQGPCSTPMPGAGWASRPDARAGSRKRRAAFNWPPRVTRPMPAPRATSATRSCVPVRSSRRGCR
ncbi:hypothetical protein [Ralstonia solanacearum]|uniref:hypothetical protein n=1 Tax=Ralstonia solanacearum TaxID=305 RepID=UPI001FED5DA4|nr:hypothetical protein [Ralstonia solanacearum]